MELFKLRPIQEAKEIARLKEMNDKVTNVTLIICAVTCSLLVVVVYTTIFLLIKRR